MEEYVCGERGVKGKEREGGREGEKRRQREGGEETVHVILIKFWLNYECVVYAEISLGERKGGK